SSIDPQTADAAIREDIEPQMGDISCFQNLVFKEVPGVGLQLGTRQNTFPDEGQVSQILLRQIARTRRFKRTTLGKVSFEPRRVDLDPTNLTGRPKFDYYPVVT